MKTGFGRDQCQALLFVHSCRVSVHTVCEGNPASFRWPRLCQSCDSRRDRHTNAEDRCEKGRLPATMPHDLDGGRPIQSKSSAACWIMVWWGPSRSSQFPSGCDKPSAIGRFLPPSTSAPWAVLSGLKGLLMIS